MKVPVLNTGRPSFWRDRDPRVKWLVFAVFLAAIYIAPGWEWMLGATALGAAIALTARAPLLWLVLMLLIHAPTIAALVIIPMLGAEFTFEPAAFDPGFEFGLRISLGWVAAILIGVGLFSTMEVDELVEGLRGLGLPHRQAFLIGYAFVLIYLSASDLTRVMDAMRLKGYPITLARPLSFLRNVPRLFVPALLTIVRRGGAMTAALETRGFDAPPPARETKPLDWIDRGVVVLTLIALVSVIVARVASILAQGG